MRVTVISPVLPPTRWAEADLAHLFAERFTALGHHTTVITSRSQGGAAPAELDAKAIMPDWTWSGLPRLLISVFRTRPDALFIIYVSPLYGRHPMVTLVPRLVRRLLPHARIVCYITYPMGSDPLMSSSWVARALNWLFGVRGADGLFGTLLTHSHRVLCMSGWQKRTLLEKDPRLTDRIQIVPTSSLVKVREDVADARLAGRRHLSLRDDEQLIAFLGFFYASKGVQHLLAAFHALIREGRALHLVLIGGRSVYEPDVVDELKERVRHLRLEDRVHWSGDFEVDSDIPSTLLHAADMAVLPFEQGVQLNHSSLSSVLAHSLPVVTTFRAATSDADFVDGHNMLLCPLSDASALASAMARILDNQDLRDRLRRGAHALYAEWYAIDRLDARLDGAIRR